MISQVINMGKIKKPKQFFMLLVTLTIVYFTFLTYSLAIFSRTFEAGVQHEELNFPLQLTKDALNSSNLPDLKLNRPSDSKIDISYHHEDGYQTSRFAEMQKGDVSIQKDSSVTSPIETGVETVKDYMFNIARGHKTVHTFGNDIYGTFFIGHDSIKDRHTRNRLSELEHLEKEIAHVNCNALPKLCPLKDRDNTRKCSWCKISKNGSVSSCVQGSFWWNTMKAPWKLNHNERTLYQQLKFEFNERQPIHLRIHHHIRYTEILFRCRFPKLDELDHEYNDGPGALSIPWISENGTKIMKLLSDDIYLIPPVKARQKRLETEQFDCIICSRGMFGEMKAENIIKHVEYYKYQGFGGVILYDIGLSSIQKRFLLDDYIAEGSLMIIDVKSFLQTLYGIKSVYVLMRSFAIGQIWLKYDCALRARHLGFEWALHVDLDEYLSLGTNHITRSGNSNQVPVDTTSLLGKHLQRLTLKEKDKNWFSFGVLKPNKILHRDPRKVDNSLCDLDIDQKQITEVEKKHLKTNFRYDWYNWVSAINQHHRDVEIPDALNYFIFNATGNPRQACKDYHRCPGVAGTRKVMMRTSACPLRLSIHRVRTRGNQDGVFDGQVLSVEDMYIRHYSCMNTAMPAYTQKRADGTVEVDRWNF